MSRKRDIRQFRHACDEVGLTVEERYSASGVQGHMSYRELVAWLRQWKG